MKWTIFCGLALIFAAPTWAQALDPDYELVKAKLKSVGVEPTGPALLNYFKERTGKQVDPKEMARLIRLLGNDTFQVREKAYQDILKLGPTALDSLKSADGDPDLEIQLRTEEIKKLIQAKLDPEVQAAAARLLAAIRPAGAAEVLLNYLPFAANQNVSMELCFAIKAATFRDGKADPLVVQALTDPLPIKRIAAAEALIGVKEHLPAIRKMAQDADPQIRLRVSIALINGKEREFLPVLIDLLGVLNAEELWQAEELLLRIAQTADKDAPNVTLGKTEETRKKCRDAWSDWLTKNSDKVDLAKLEQVQAYFGYTLIVQQSPLRFLGGKQIPPTGVVMELDKEKKVRWRFELPNVQTVDAFVIRQDRVLVAEHSGSMVTERDFAGKEIGFKQALPGRPISVQGLPNGNVFVVMQNRIIEYDRDNKEVFTLNRFNEAIFRGRKLRNGDVVFITNNGQLTRMDAKQMNVKTYFVGYLPGYFGSMDTLPNGNVIVPDHNRSKIVEFDANGKKLDNEIFSQFPSSVMRLPNGNTLVGSQSTRRIVELDPRGVEVWAYQMPVTDGTFYNARRR